MARTKSTASLTKPAITRQARRLTKQQKRLEIDIMATTGGDSIKLTGASRRTLSVKDLKDIQPQTRTQDDVFDAFHEFDALALIGSAGSGKSFVAMYLSLLEILTPESGFDKIIIVRSTAQTRDVGFLPGELEDKQAPFEEPYKSICADLLGRKDAYDKLKDMGRIEFATTSFLRGSTFNDSIVIFDEMQNTTFQEFSTVATRVGKNSKFIAIGDGGQTDISKTRSDQSGFRDAMNVIYAMPQFSIHTFTTDDIVRSGFVKAWLIACESLGL